MSALSSAARAPLRRVLRLLLPLLIVVALLVVGHLWRWDGQLRLYWHERTLGEAQRAADIWLPDYRLVLETTLTGLEEDEASGLTWSPQSNTLFTVTGKTPLLVELAPNGAILRRIRLDGFANPEAVEDLGDGRLAIVDERRHRLAVARLEPDTQSLNLADLPSYDLGFAEAGNKGFEGLAWDPQARRLLLAKERSPLGLFSLPLPETGAAVVPEPLPSEHLPVRDLSSVAVDPRSGHVLLLSDESRLLLELDRQGQPRSFISLLRGLHGLSHGIDQAEGVAMDTAGNLYLVEESGRFYVFSKAAAR